MFATSWCPELFPLFNRPAKYAEVVAKMKEAENGKMKGILGVSDEDVVSQDFLGDPRSSIFDSKAGIAISDNFLKVGNSLIAILLILHQ